MPRFEPFQGLRYDLTRASADEVTAPPYDVIDDELRAELGARHPDNVVHVDLPLEIDGRDRYDVAAETFQRWQDEGILVRDAAPALYAYSLSYTDDAGVDRETLGVIGALELSAPGEGGILAHEHTTPKARSDRLQMLRSCRANLSAIWGLSAAPGLTDMLRTGTPPAAEWSADGVLHRMWVIDDPDTVDAICTSVGAVPFVIADGHHRYETSLAYRDERRDADGDAGPADLVMVYTVELAEENLTVRPIHRLVNGLPDDIDIAAALEPWFEVTPIGPASSLDASIAPTMTADGFLTLLVSDHAWSLVPRPEQFTGVRDLDSSRLDAALGAVAPHELTFQHGVDNVVKRVLSGDAQAGVLLRPASVGQILEVSNGGERMPPKTTFFHPKLATGLVFRSLQTAISP